MLAANLAAFTKFDLLVFTSLTSCSQYPPTLDADWLCVDVDGYKIITICKLPPTRLQTSDLPVFLYPSLYAAILIYHTLIGDLITTVLTEKPGCIGKLEQSSLFHIQKYTASFQSGR